MDVLRERGTSLQTNAPDSTLKSRHGPAGGRNTGVAGLGESASVQPSTWEITNVPLAYFCLSQEYAFPSRLKHSERIHAVLCSESAQKEAGLTGTARGRACAWAEQELRQFGASRNRAESFPRARASQD